MVNPDYILGKLPVYQGKKVLVKEFQSTKDIIGAVMAGHKQFADDYDKISDQFRRSSVRATCAAIFDFLKANVRYSIEPDEAQSVCSPSAIIARGKGDCKHYASFTCGVLASLARKGMKVEPWFRFASYRLGNKTPGHVFAVVKTNRGEIWIDPVLPDFDSREKTPNYTTDRSAMALYNISGIDGVGKFRFGRFLLKVGAAPSRNAFLLLLKLNVFNIAGKISSAIKAGKGEKYKNAWEKAGGNWKQFQKDVERGAKRRAKRVAHSKHSIHGIEGTTIGMLPAAAAIAAATPLILIFVKLLKGDGVETEDVTSAVASGAKALQGGSGGDDVSGFPYTIAQICGIGANHARRAARKAKKAAKKATRKAKRATRKETRKAKRAARKAARDAKKAGGDDGDTSTSGGGTSSSSSNLVDTALNAASQVYHVATGTEADGTESLNIKDAAEVPESQGGEGGGFGIDSKTLMIVGGVGALLLLTKKGRR